MGTETMEDAIDRKVQEAKEWMATLLEKVDSINAERFRILEQANQQFEQQLALLVQGFGSMSVMLNTILQVKLEDVDPELFKQVYQQQATQMVKSFQDGLHQARSDQQKFHPGAAVNSDGTSSED